MNPYWWNLQDLDSLKFNILFVNFVFLSFFLYAIIIALYVFKSTFYRLRLLILLYLKTSYFFLALTLPYYAYVQEHEHDELLVCKYFCRLNYVSDCKSTCCLFRGPGFNSKHPHNSSEPSVTTVAGDLTRSSGFHRH